MLLQWLSSEHAERLAGAVNRGEFLLLVEVHSMVEERVERRILLRNCHGLSKSMTWVQGRKSFGCNPQRDLKLTRGRFPLRLYSCGFYQNMVYIN